LSDRYRITHLLEKWEEAQDLKEFIHCGRKVSKLISTIDAPQIGEITRITSRRLIDKQVENLTAYLEKRAEPATPPIEVSKSICRTQIEKILSRLS
jgi:hypothetical protein